MEFFENICNFAILRYEFLIEISISELFGHFYFWHLCYGGLSEFLTGLGFIASAEDRLRLDQNFEHDMIHKG